ncbi:MAG TPA: FadR/GntR family transcriptional regulator [Trebonia sp.]|nr:FadR/GntR family transcriptional regulator [Trebonia sp.]
MPLAGVSRSTLVESVITRLEELITSGEWPVGHRVPAEPELVKALGVSRNTVREAVRALVHAGLLDPRPGDGTYVLASTGLDAALERAARQWGAIDALEVRSMLERDAARLAAQRRDDEDVAAIEAALVRRHSAQADDDRAFVEADAAFHTAVVAATHNQVLIELYAHLATPLRESVSEALRADSNAHDFASHEALARAIRLGDPAAAEQAATTVLAVALAAFGADAKPSPEPEPEPEPGPEQPHAHQGQSR